MFFLDLHPFNNQALYNIPNNRSEHPKTKLQKSDPSPSSSGLPTQDTSSTGAISCNYAYLLSWPLWETYLYIFSSRLFYNCTLYVFTVFQFLISIHFYGIEGVFAFCCFIAIKDLIVTIPDAALLRTMSFTSVAKQITNDFTYIRATVILYIIIATCSIMATLVLFMPLSDHIFNSIARFIGLMEHCKDCNYAILTKSFTLMFLPFQGPSLSFCNILSMEHRYFLAGVVSFTLMLLILLFQFTYLLLTKTPDAVRHEVSSDFPFVLEGIQQIAFGACNILVTVYMLLVNRVSRFQRRNIFISFRYVHCINFHMVAKVFLKTIFVILQHAYRPIMLLFMQHKIGQTVPAFESYSFQIFSTTFYYMLIKCLEAIILSAGECYGITKAIYIHAKMVNELRTLNLFFVSVTLVACVTILIILHVYRYNILLLFTPLSFRISSDLFSVYIESYSSRYIFFISCCTIHLVFTLFSTYSNVNTMLEKSLSFSSIILLYKYMQLFFSIFITMDRITSDVSLYFIFLIPDLTTLPLYVLRMLWLYSRMVRKSPSTSSEEKQTQMCSEAI